MRQAAPRVAAITAAGGGAGQESLVVLVDRTGRESGLGSSIRDQSPSGANGLRLRLEGASFDAMIAWLAVLQQRYGVSVSDATIDAAAAPGLVNASITLTHGANAAP
jgi:type II secretory pathway component PulM